MTMLYIHQTTCISPQPAPDEPADRFTVVEPAYPGIPANTLRRMSKAVRMGVGAALALPRQAGAPDGILIGTGYGGMEESVKFLRQVIEYEEGLLAPGHFVQSIPNAIASQIGLSSANRGYNTTYVHQGLGFEHALIDAGMLLQEHPGSRWLVGGVDEFSGYHHQIELADGWYKTAVVPGQRLYDYASPGSIAGEGAALFLVDERRDNALAAIKGVLTLHSRDGEAVPQQLRRFLERHLPGGGQPDLLFTGENGDSRALPWHEATESCFGPATTIARFKHLCGEYPTASAFALWLACRLEQGRPLPGHLVKRAATVQPHQPPDSPGTGYLDSGHPHPGLPAPDPSITACPRYRHILLYNNYKLSQHSFILLERFR